jgi:hypothetical protein
MVFGAAVAMVLGFGTAPAQAAEPHPLDINGVRFWSGKICVDGSAINGRNWRVGYIAQQWNLRVADTNVLALDYADDCVAAGYPPSRRMVIGTFSNPNYGECLLPTNKATDEHNGMSRWTKGPGMYINVGISGCFSTQNRRDHNVSSAIGWLLGLTEINSPDSKLDRVMNQTTQTLDNIPLPDPVSGQRVKEIYQGKYGG